MSPLLNVSLRGYGALALLVVADIVSTNVEGAHWLSIIMWMAAGFLIGTLMKDAQRALERDAP